VSGIVVAETGIHTIDQAINELYETGYMHNHARMWTAMLACNVGKANWKNMSRWLYYHLIDGDLASNTLSWQWVAGTSINKQYVANQELINTCSNNKQTNTYLDVERDLVGTVPVPVALQATQVFNLSTTYPASEDINSLAGKTVFLYHPWSIAPLWRAAEEGERIFVIEPRLFDTQPVSSVVMEHMLRLVRTHIPNAQVYVGNVEELLDLDKATVYSKSHPTTKHWPGTKDSVSELFPHVQGYHQSFFKFWQVCQKSSNHFSNGSS
jgi:deoxyribodipyrimidine photo-lyase